MGDLRWKIHAQRRKHQRHMAQAEANIEKTQFHQREANRYSKGMSVDYADAAKSHVISGWGWMEHAIGQVVECGCPRSLWPEQVQGAIKDNDDE